MYTSPVGHLTWHSVTKAVAAFVLAIPLVLGNASLSQVEAANNYNVVGAPSGLHERTGPGTQFPVVSMLSNGSPITILCQQHGSRPLAASDVWDKLSNGFWVYDYYTNTPGVGVITWPCGGAAPTQPSPPPAPQRLVQLVLLPSCTANWAFIQGHNQYDQIVSQLVLVPAAVPENGCLPDFPVYDRGWWWKGQVRIDGYWDKNKTQYSGTTYVNMPSNPPSEWDWVQVPG